MTSTRKNMDLWKMLAKHKFELVSVCRCTPKSTREEAVQINDDSHLIHVLRGRGVFQMDDIRRDVMRGDVVAIRPFTEFRMELEAGFEMLNIHYRLHLESGVMFEERIAFPDVFRRHDVIDLEQKLVKLASMWNAGGPDRAFASVLAHDIVLGHMKHAEPVSRACHDTVMESTARKLASGEYVHFQAEELARRSFLSVSQFNRRFRKAFAVSPRRYWEKHMLARICMDIARTNMSLGAIAENNGFQDQAYFSRWFRRMTGESPLNYRRSILEPGMGV